LVFRVYLAKGTARTQTGTALALVITDRPKTAAAMLRDPSDCECFHGKGRKAQATFSGHALRY
jgi:hypothetical protein